MTLHLWEVDHPYYAAEGNYHAADCHTRLDSWAEFTETTFHSGDRDLNLLYRWDWWPADPEIPGDTDQLRLFFILQRKAIACSIAITVTQDDEPAIRKWLEECGRTVAAIWEPLTLAAAG
ncbi:hypothetical protein ACWEPB_02600 [Kitasatospora cineracea]